MRWNPEVATGNPAHVTIIYHDEAPDLATLRSRLAAACRGTAPFDLSAGRALRFRAPLRGAFLEVTDALRHVQAIREAVLEPRLARSRFGLHVTLLHPDQGERVEAAWPALSGLPAPGTFTVRTIDLVSGSAAETRIIDVFDLAG